MTRAVCLSCGAYKVGALVLCRKCRVVPTEAEDQARALLASDQYLEAEALESVANAVAAGQPVDFDEAEVADLARTVAENPTPPVWFALLVMGVPLIGVLLTLVGAALLLRAC